MYTIKFVKILQSFTVNIDKMNLFHFPTQLQHSHSKFNYL